MIKVNKGKCIIEGKLPNIAVEVVVVLKHFNAICVEQLGETGGTSFYEKTLSVANMNDWEIDKEAKRARLSVFLKKILGIED